MHKPTLLLISLALLAVTASAQDASRTNKTQEAAAAQGLALLRALAGDKASDLGFKSSNDAARATLGTPLPVYNVDLADLKNFPPGGDASALLKPSPAAFYPVLLDGAVSSGVRVENTGAGWEAARVGNAGLATAVDRARRALPKPDDSATVLVQVLALNLLFVGQKDANGWQLAPVIDDPSVELRVGKAEPAAAVFVRLAPIAARQNGDPT
jgi:type II secretory pathway pseudopilin PulG